ncbi:MAG: spermidine/putrescine transport system permease protein [Rhodospirillaceae bacterium]|jgi:spermidine/putrescine transport system permease protein|nr:spermidine/putrescine transport system permease protein [Rhodospirillaceae bacterium]
MAATAMSAAERRRPWLLLSPTLVTLGLLMVIPTIVMFVYSFYTDLGGGRDKADFNLANWAEFFTDSYYHFGIWQTVRVSAITTVLCALMGYPAGYVVAMTRFRHKWLLLLLLIVPFWISFIIRTLSWIHILGEQGAINASLRWLGLIDQPLPMLYNEGSVIMGMIHFLLPYMILNVYVSLEGIDRNLLSAARTLGCTPWQAFREVTLPLSLPGLGAGSLLCFVLAAGSYITPAVLGGPGDFLFGNLIYDAIMSQLNWPLGATLSIVLFVLLGGVSVVYSRYMGLSRIYRGLSR